MESSPDTDAPSPEPEAEAAAPLVTVVMVACDPGPWFEEALASVATQDYPEVSVLVVDAASVEPVEARVQAVLPAAIVRRIDERNYSRAANHILGDPAAGRFLLFCHDDVRLETDAVRLLIEEAFRSNAGIAGAKLVQWDDARRLLQVGMSIDKLATAAPLVDSGELDQEQHDAVRDVFYTPGGCFLVRADLFEALGGFDETYDVLGEDLDLCWRAHLAGARVLAVPAARVAHREALDERRPAADRRRTDRRHRARIVLTCYSRWHLLRVLPQALLVTLVESLVAVLTGHPSGARDAIGAWTWNLRRPGDLRARRKSIAAHRRVKDAEIRGLQVHGFTRVNRFLRGQSGTSGERVQGIGGAGRSVVNRLREPGAQRAVALWLVVLALVIIGSRHIITQRFPAFGEFARFPADSAEALELFGGAVDPGGLGGDGPAPALLAALGLVGWIVLGHLALLRTLLVLGGLVMGLIGAWRLPRASASRRSQMVALVAYATVPVGASSIELGHASGLVLYALAPFLLGVLARASGQPPFRAPRLLHSVLVMGLLVGIGSLFVPATGAIVVVVALALGLGSVLAGQPAGAGRTLLVAVGGSALGAVLVLPWSTTWLSGWDAYLRPRQSPITSPEIADLLRFHTGSVGVSVLGWGLLVAAALAVFIGRDWRLAWAIRGWFVALTSWGLAVAGVEGWLPVAAPPVEVLLAPAAAGLALAVAMGMAAFEVDLRETNFGWRQLLSVACGGALVFATLPFIAAAIVDGRWGAPGRDLQSTLAFIDDERAEVEFRVLWIGDPDVLPLTGWVFDDGASYQIANDGFPGVVELFPGDRGGVNAPLRDALGAAADDETIRLGGMLAPLNIRYVLLAQRMNPGADTIVVPDSPLIEALPEQLDLAEVELSPAVRVWENAAWQDPPDAADSSTGATRAVGLVLAALAWVSVAVLALQSRASARKDEA